jgi:hypothetical protein
VERALSIRASFSGKGPVVEYYAKELSYLTFEWEGEQVSAMPRMTPLSHPVSCLQ